MDNLRYVTSSGYYFLSLIWLLFYLSGYSKTCTLLHVIVFVVCNDASDVASLARAAVSGDENALDMFMWSKDTAAATSVKLSSSLYKKEAFTFYVASDDGKNTNISITI